MSQDMLVTRAADLCLQMDKESLAQLLEILASHCGGAERLAEIAQTANCVETVLY